MRVALTDATVVGEVVALDPASLDIALEDGVVRSANRSEVFRLERSLPGHWVWLAGTGVGFAVGCHLGVCLDDDSLGDADDWRMAGIGAAAGFAVTALSGFELWEGISLPDRPEGPTVGDRVRVALADMTIEGDVTSIGHQSFEVADDDGRVRSVDRSQIFRLERGTARRLWLEGFAAGFVLGSAYVMGKFFSHSGDAAGCALTLGYAAASCDKLGLGNGERLLVAAMPIAGLAIGMTQRVEAWKSVDPRSPGGGPTPIFDLGVDAGGHPVVLLGGRFRH